MYGEQIGELLPSLPDTAVFCGVAGGAYGEFTLYADGDTKEPIMVNTLTGVIIVIRWSDLYCLAASLTAPARSGQH